MLIKNYIFLLYFQLYTKEKKIRDMPKILDGGDTKYHPPLHITPGFHKSSYQLHQDALKERPKTTIENAKKHGRVDLYDAIRRMGEINRGTTMPNAYTPKNRAVSGWATDLRRHSDAERAHLNEYLLQGILENWRL